METSYTRVKARIKRNLASGLIVLAPIAVTAFVVLWIYNRIAGISPWIYDRVSGALPEDFVTLIESLQTGSTAVNELLRVGVLILVLLAFLIAIGWLVRTTVGVILQRWLDELANRIPGLRMVYNATKMAIETVLGDTTDFQSPTKIDIQGLRFTAFKTGNKTEDGREIIFLPTAPNITTGFVIEIESEKLEETDENVEEALTRILSAGFGDKQTEGIELVEEEYGDESSSDE